MNIARRPSEARLAWVQAGPVSPSHQALLTVLQCEGFEHFGCLVILERRISRFKS